MHTEKDRPFRMVVEVARTDLVGVSIAALIADGLT